MTAPVSTINDFSLHINDVTQLKNRLAYSDADGDPAVKFQFWDSGAAADSAYISTSADPHWMANTTIDVSAADLDSVYVHAGTGAAGTNDAMWVRAFDGS